MPPAGCARRLLQRARWRLLGLLRLPISIPNKLLPIRDFVRGELVPDVVRQLIRPERHGADTHLAGSFRVVIVRIAQKSNSRWNRRSP